MTDNKPKIPTSGGAARFLKRTAVATLITVLLVALFTSVYVGGAWAARYLFAGLWALVFFALTPMIFRAMITERKTVEGLVWIAIKFLWLGVLFAVCYRWALGAQTSMAEAMGLVAGLTTPLAVAALRGIGMSMQTHDKKRMIGSSTSPKVEAKS